MSNFINWNPARPVSVTNLILDVENPRLSYLGPNPTTTDIIQYLIDYEDVMTLIRRIVYFGYMPNENPIVIKSGGNKYTVLEGNRRVAACKLLLNPNLAPANKRATIQKLAAEMPQKIEKLAVIPVNKKEHADILIENRHTTTQIKTWDPTKQDRFYYKQLIAGATIKDIARKFNRKPSTISSSIKRYHVYREATSLNLGEELLKKVADETEFDVTNLERFYTFSNGRKFLGITFNEDGTFTTTLDTDDFTNRFKKVLQDIVDKKFNSRIANNEKNFEKYFTKMLTESGFIFSDDETTTSVSEIENNGTPTSTTTSAKSTNPEQNKEVPSSINNSNKDSALEDISTNSSNSKQGEPNSNSGSTIQGGNPPLNTGRETQTSVDEKRPKRSNTLVQNEEYCDSSIPRLDKVFEELKKLNLDNHTNAVAVLFRSFLEMVTYSFLELNEHTKLLLIDKGKEIQAENEKRFNRIKELVLGTGVSEESFGEIQNRIKKISGMSGNVGTDWTPTLMAMLTYLTRTDINLISDKQMKEGLEHYLHPKRNKLSHYDFNKFVHNAYTIPQKEELIEIWEHLSPLIKFMIRKIRVLSN